MTEMVERVAKAIFDVYEPHHANDFSAIARAAIEALREPTEAMLAAAHDSLTLDSAEPVWKAMIEAALNKEEPGSR